VNLLDGARGMVLDGGFSQGNWDGWLRWLWKLGGRLSRLQMRKFREYKRNAISGWVVEHEISWARLTKDKFREEMEVYISPHRSIYRKTYSSQSVPHKKRFDLNKKEDQKLNNKKP
jgi:hypothetical protein